MAEIIKFPGTDTPEDQPEEKTVQNLSELIEISSIDALYDEDALTIEGQVSVGEFRARLAEADRNKGIQGLESALADARGKFILATLPKCEQRTRLLIELAKNTYVAAKSYGNTELMDWASNELQTAFGIGRAMMVIESLNLKDQLGNRSD